MWKFNEPPPRIHHQEIVVRLRFPPLVQIPFVDSPLPTGCFVTQNQIRMPFKTFRFGENNQIGKFSDGLSEISTLTPTSELPLSAPSQSSSRSSRSSCRLHRASASELSEPRPGDSSSHGTTSSMEGVGNRGSSSNQVKILGPGLDGSVTAAFFG